MPSQTSSLESLRERKSDMDLTETIVPKSDQLNAEDLLTGPRTFTVADVKKGSAEQPVDIVLVEFPGRPFRPSKTVRRILVAAWGPDASTYTGRRMTLYRDPSVRFGGADVGGIRVSHLSHIDKPLSVALTVSRGKRQPFTVQPLPEAAGDPWATAVAAASTEDELRAVWDRFADGLDRNGRAALTQAMTTRRADLIPEGTDHA